MDAERESLRESFLAEWRLRYPEIPPIQNLLNHRRFPDRWMRIHSLPLSKRYADTNAEWDILLHRQNALIDHLVPQGAAIRIMVNWIGQDKELLRSFDAEPIGVFQEADDEPGYESFLARTIWKTRSLDSVLRRIADETLRAFIIAPDGLIAPYDGGVNVVAKDSHGCLELKREFKDWLSSRADGL